MALTPCPSYDADRLGNAVRACWKALGFTVRPGESVLVKPNLVTSRQAHLSCTHPQVVRAVCILLLDQGAKVQVGDSPAFGSARQVARAAGLPEALRGLNVPTLDLNQPIPRRLGGGIQVGISRHVLEADLVLNLPKLKAHSQLVLTAASKNLFGCVSGVRKALAHVRHGQGDELAALILDLQPHLPPTSSLLDAITAMHVSGPASGLACQLGLLAAGNNPVALDTAVSRLLGLTPDHVPLWRQARDKKLPGHHPSQISYPLSAPADLHVPTFQVPTTLNPVSFHPWQMTRSMCRRAWLRLRDSLSQR